MCTLYTDYRCMCKEPLKHMYMLCAVGCTFHVADGPMDSALYSVSQTSSHLPAESFYCVLSKNWCMTGQKCSIGRSHWCKPSTAMAGFEEELAEVAKCK